MLWIINVKLILALVKNLMWKYQAEKGFYHPPLQLRHRFFRYGKITAASACHLSDTLTEFLQHRKFASASE